MTLTMYAKLSPVLLYTRTDLGERHQLAQEFERRNIVGLIIREITFDCISGYAPNTLMLVTPASIANDDFCKVVQRGKELGYDVRILEPGILSQLEPFRDIPSLESRLKSWPLSNSSI